VEQPSQPLPLRQSLVWHSVERLQRLGFSLREGGGLMKMPIANSDAGRGGSTALGDPWLATGSRGTF
jgi:hypothetical protein